MVPPQQQSDIPSRAFEDGLNKTVRKALPKSEFNASVIPSRQARRMTRLPNHGAALHGSWQSLDKSRRSAACLYEWARLQLFMATEVLPILLCSDLDFYHVTLVDKRWRVQPSSADRMCFDRPRRKVRAAIALLRDNGYSPVHIAAYELSGDRNRNDDYTFEPHVHLLIGGVPKEALQIAFDIRLPRSERGRHKPVRASEVPAHQLPNVLSYITKTKAQDRVEFIASDGRPRRKSNRMRSGREAHWLRCMATMPITHLIQFGGFAEPLTSRFTHREMATIVGETK